MESQGLEIKEEIVDIVNSNVQDALEPGEICSSDSDVDISTSLTSSSIYDGFEISKGTSIEVENCCIEKNFTHEGRRVYLKKSPLILMKNQFTENERGYKRINIDFNSGNSDLKKLQRYSNLSSKMQNRLLIKKFKKLSEKIELNLHKLEKINNYITKSNSEQLISSTTRKLINKYKKELVDLKYQNASNEHDNNLHWSLDSKELIQTNLHHISSQLDGHKRKPLTSNKSTHTKDVILELRNRTYKEDLFTEDPKLKKTSSETSIASYSSLKYSSDVSNKSSDNSKSFSTRKTNTSSYINMKHKIKESSLCDGNLQSENAEYHHNRYRNCKDKKFLQSHSTSRLHKTSAREYKSHRRNHRREFHSRNDVIEKKSSENKHDSQKYKKLHKTSGDDFTSKTFDNCNINSERYRFYNREYNKQLSTNEQNEFNYFNMMHTKYSEKQNLYSNYVDEESNIPIVEAECSSKCHQIQLSQRSSLPLENERHLTNVSLMPKFITTQSLSKSESSLPKVLVQPPPPGVESPTYLHFSTYIPNMEMVDRDMPHGDNYQYSTYSSKSKNSCEETSVPNPSSNKFIKEEHKENNRNHKLLKKEMSSVATINVRNESFKSLSQHDQILEHQDKNTNQNIGITEELPVVNDSEKINAIPSEDNLSKINQSLHSSEQSYINPHKHNISDITQPRCSNFDYREKNNDPINIYNTTENSNQELVTISHEPQDCGSIITLQSIEPASDLIDEYKNNQRIPVISATKSNLKEFDKNILLQSSDSQSNSSDNVKEDNVQNETIHMSQKIFTSKNILAVVIGSSTQDSCINSNMKQQEISKTCTENVVENLCSPQTENRLKYDYQKIYNINIYPEDSEKAVGQISEHIKQGNILEIKNARNAVFYAYHKYEAKSYKRKITFQKSELSFDGMNDIKRGKNASKLISKDLEEKQSETKRCINNLPYMVLKHLQSSSLQTSEVLKRRSVNEENDVLCKKNMGKVDVENNIAFSPINTSEGAFMSRRSCVSNGIITNHPKASVSVSKQDGTLFKKSFTAEKKKIFKKTAMSPKNLHKKINMTINEDKNTGNYSIQQMVYKEKSNNFFVYKGGLNIKQSTRKQKVSGNKMPSKCKQKKHISNYSLCWQCRSSTKNVGCFANMVSIPNK